MGNRYLKKNLGDPNWSKPNNYKIKQNDAIYDVEIVPNKGVKGDASAQPFNDKNAEDIENALVSLDDDLAFIEEDYVTEAENALKQNITDNSLNTTNKTIVGAINEVKSEGEYHDLLQDDAIAIVNNKINALPMNGSLKNIRTSLVGIPTTFTNIDMFNTKQTVTNYQPLSLDYKGAAEPHIVLMKTVGDYTFVFSVEATHTNGTDTAIIIEAWVDGVLYETATRTLVGGSNQINGINGFFTYSKGTDATISEIYFRFRASQGNTSANKTLINTTLFGNSSESSFTDTDHVTGINLSEPTYNGATTSFIINDLKSDVDSLELNKLDKSGGEVTGSLTIPNGTKVKGSNVDDIVGNSYIQFMNNDLTKRTGFIGDGSGNDGHMTMYADTGDVVLYPTTGIARVKGNEILTTASKIQTVFSLDELGLDGTWVLGDVPGNIKKAYDAGVIMVGNDKPFTIIQGLFREASSNHYEFSQSIEDSIIADYGIGIGSTDFEFSIDFGTFNGVTSHIINNTNFISIKSSSNSFTRQFDFDGWANSSWVDEAGGKTYRSIQHVYRVPFIMDRLGENPNGIHVDITGGDIDLTSSKIEFDVIGEASADVTGGMAIGQLFLNSNSTSNTPYDRQEWYLKTGSAANTPPLYSNVTQNFATSSLMLGRSNGKAGTAGQASTQAKLTLNNVDYGSGTGGGTSFYEARTVATTNVFNAGIVMEHNVVARGVIPGASNSAVSDIYISWFGANASRLFGNIIVTTDNPNLKFNITGLALLLPYADVEVGTLD